MTFHQWRATTKLAMIIGYTFFSSIYVSHMGVVRCSPIEIKVARPFDFSILGSAVLEASPKRSPRALEHDMFIAPPSSALSSKQEVVNTQERQQLVPITRPPALDHQEVSEHFQAATKRVLIVDYDGTLVPFQPRPHQAVPSDALIEVLDRLDKDPHTDVVIISGRDEAFLEEHFGKYSTFHLSAEYGALSRKPGEKWVWPEDLESKLVWKGYIKNSMDEVIKKHNDKFKDTVWVEQKNTALVLHYRELNESDLPLKNEGLKEIESFFEQLKANKQLEANKLKVENDNLALEVRMADMFNKGEIAEQVLQSKTGVQVVLCPGDSRADEDMIKVVREMSKQEKYFAPDAVAITIHVDNEKGGTEKAFQSNAQFEAKNPQEVTDLLRKSVGLPPADITSGFEEKKRAANAKHAEKIATFTKKQPADTNSYLDEKLAFKQSSQI